MNKHKVIVEIVGGVPSVIECPPEVDVESRQINHWQRWYEQQRKLKQGAINGTN